MLGQVSGHPNVVALHLGGRGSSAVLQPLLQKNHRDATNMSKKSATNLLGMLSDHFRSRLEAWVSDGSFYVFEWVADIEHLRLLRHETYLESPGLYYMIMERLPLNRHHG